MGGPVSGIWFRKFLVVASGGCECTKGALVVGPRHPLSESTCLRASPASDLRICGVWVVWGWLFTNIEAAKDLSVQQGTTKDCPTTSPVDMSCCINTDSIKAILVNMVTPWILIMAALAVGIYWNFCLDGGFNPNDTCIVDHPPHDVSKARPQYENIFDAHLWSSSLPSNTHCMSPCHTMGFSWLKSGNP